MEMWALRIAFAVAAVFLVLFFVVASPETSRVDAPTGQGPTSRAPTLVDTPEGAKPAEKRHSN